MAGIGDGLLALSRQTEGFDEIRYRRDIDRLTREYLVYGESASVGQALTGIIGALLDDGLHLDPALTMAIKAMVQADATARSLAPQGRPRRHRDD